VPKCFIREGACRYSKVSRLKKKLVHDELAHCQQQNEKRLTMRCGGRHFSVTAVYISVCIRHKNRIECLLHLLRK
jgi:hypothetical protein